MATIGQYTFDWITDDQASTLLGKARPKTLQDIEGDSYWGDIFKEWVRSADGGSCPGIQTAYDNWVSAPTGPARDKLKKIQDFDVRKEFYEDLGGVKAALREQDRESGAGVDRINEAMGGILDE